MERSFEREIIPMARSEGNDYLVIMKKTFWCWKKKHRHGSGSLERPCRQKNKNNEEEGKRCQTGEKGRTLRVYLCKGQSCMAGSRIFVQGGIYDQFLRKFSATTAELGT